jgi:hypothetical protein
MNDWMPLHQQLFLTVHDNNGQPRTHANALNVSLAAAVLAELVLGENIQVQRDRFWVINLDTAPTDPVAAATIAAMFAIDGPKQISHWLRVMSGDIYDRVSGGLLAAGLVMRETRKREARYPHTNTHVAGQRLGELRAAITGHHVPHPSVLALAGFFALLRLEGMFGLNVPAGDVVDRLKVLVSWSSSAVQEVLARAGQLIGDNAMSAYR